SSKLHQAIRIEVISRESKETGKVVGRTAGEHQDLISLDAEQRLEDKAIVRGLPPPALEIGAVPELPPVHGKANPRIIHAKHSRDRQALTAEDAVEHQFVAERQPVLNRSEQRPEPAGRPPTVGEIILLIGIRD